MTLKPETIAAQAAGAIDEATGAVVPAIHIATTFERAPDNSYPNGLVYSRADNVTTRQAEQVINHLEGGARTLLLGSGMAAATALFLALRHPGEASTHVVAPKVMYWSLRNWLINEAPAYGLTASFFDNADLATLAAAIRPGETRLVWLETPANPLWTITDIAAAARVAHDAGALIAVDSTGATPVLTRPLALGADVVMHAATKYLNGHSDVLAGSLTFARDDDLAARAAAVRKNLGAVLGPFEAALLMRGMRTLYVRVRHQSAAAMTIARHFRGHAGVEEVLYPGLTNAPGHDIAATQMQGGFGGMLSIRVKGGEVAAIRCAARLKVWKRATSLGGVESLVEHRASIEGPGTPCPPDLLRLSTGIENADDLIADLEHALAS